MRYDHIIVGAGSAGAALAARLTEDPDRSVLLLEAGGDYPEFERIPEEVRLAYGSKIPVWDSDHIWNFSARATDIARMDIPRGKITGGSSGVNGAQFLRGVREDYDRWAEWGNDAWSFENVLPYFKRMEADQDYRDEYHGNDGAIMCRRYPEEDWPPHANAFYEACRDAGFPDCPDHNRPDSTGVGPLTFNIIDGVRMSTNIGYLNPARHRLNLTIRSNCHVHGIIFDENQAVGALVISGREMFSVYGDEIVLCAGAVGTPHILLLSGVGPGEQLRELGIPVVQDLPGVGRNLRDHPDVPLCWYTKEDYPLDVNQTTSGTVTLRYTAEGSPFVNDMIVYMANYLAARPFRGLDEKDPVGIGASQCLYLALSEGELRLQSTDPRQQPILDYNLLDDPFDRKRMRDGLRLCNELFKHSAFSEIVEKRAGPSDEVMESDALLDEWMKTEVVTAHHISSTCKMGPSSDPLAVCDQYGRVYGLDGLRIVDASIMPDTVRANLNVTVMTMGEKVADFIKQGS